MAKKENFKAILSITEKGSSGEKLFQQLSRIGRINANYQPTRKMARSAYLYTDIYLHKSLGVKLTLCPRLDPECGVYLWARSWQGAVAVELTGMQWDWQD